jgi:GTPase
MLIISYSNKIIPNQPEEKYYGNREYKLYLDTLDNNEKLQKRSTQLLYRLNEGSGRALYLFGVSDNGNSIGCNKQALYNSIKSIISMSNVIKSKITKIQIYRSYNGNFICSVRCKKDTGI